MEINYFALILQSISVLTPLLVIFIKTNRNHKKTTTSIEDLKLIVLESDSERNFEKDLLKAIQKASTEFIDNTNLDDDGTISLLVQWKNKFHKLALDSYKSGYRGDKRKTEIYLSNEIDSIMINIRLYSQNFFPKEREFQSKYYTFLNFLFFYTELSVIVRGLKRKLIENGLSDQEYIDLFQIFITESFKEIYKGKKRWSKLDKTKQTA